MTAEEEAEFNFQCANMRESFQYLFDCGDLSRMPTDAEIALVPPRLRARIESCQWNQTEQENVFILCSVTDITTTLEA